MVTIAQTLLALNVDGAYLTNEPTTEAEFNTMFKKIVSVDEHGTAVESDNPSDFGVTWAEVSAKRDELQAEYDAAEYQRTRANAYPSIQEQLDMQYWDSVNGTTTWADAIAQVKADNPKPE